MKYIEKLQNRYSVKKFDKARKVPPDTLQNILQAGKLSASSMGLQPYKIFVVESEGMKEKLIPTFRNLSQISTCSHLIVIVAKKVIETTYVEGYLKHITEIREIAPESLDPFRNTIHQFLKTLSAEELLNWNQKQAYIVLGQLMFAAALENVDSSPMEGFNHELMDGILGLDKHIETSVVTLALGYRAEDDSFQHLKKVRKPDEKLFKFI